MKKQKDNCLMDGLQTRTNKYTCILSPFIGVTILLIGFTKSLSYANSGAHIEMRPLYGDQYQPSFSDAHPYVDYTIPSSFSGKLNVYQSSVYLTVSFQN